MSNPAPAISSPVATMSGGTVLPMRRLSPTAWLLLAISAVWCVLWFVHAYGYWEDDAYIHLEFARSVSRGLGFAFNGHVVYGDTSPLWVYLLIAFHSILPAWIVAGKALCAAGVLFACGGVFALGRRLTGDTLFAAAMVLLFVLNPFFNYWAFSGMETVTAAGVACWGAVLVSDRVIAWPRFLAGCLIVGIGPITRPEMAFLSAILAVVLLYRWAQHPAGMASKVGPLLAGLVLAVGPTLAWSMYALRTFGLLVPNTNAAKRAAVHDSVATRLASVYALGYPAIVVGVLAGVMYLVLHRTRGRVGMDVDPLRGALRSLPAAGWVFLVWTAITTVFYIVNHTYVQTRYVLVSASGLLITVLALVYLAFPRWVRPAVALVGLVAGAVSLNSTWLFIHNKIEADRRNDAMALWIDHNVPANAPVAIYSIGQFAYDSPHPIIDTGGITRPSVIPYLSDAAAVERWARREGALYTQQIDDRPIDPGATLVYSVEEPETGWYLNRRHYREHKAWTVWKFSPAPSASGSLPK